MMSRRRKRPGKGDPFIMLPHYLVKTPAWRSLPADAVKVLIDVWVRHNGVNNGEIAYGVREAAEIGITKTPAGRMLHVLIERGFLVIMRDGAFNVGNRKTRMWRLTAEPYHEQKATKDFMRWNGRAHAEEEAAPVGGTSKFRT
jgi:hypothetical protein